MRKYIIITILIAAALLALLAAILKTREQTPYMPGSALPYAIEANNSGE